MHRISSRTDYTLLSEKIKSNKSNTKYHTLAKLFAIQISYRFRWILQILTNQWNYFTSLGCDICAIPLVTTHSVLVCGEYCVGPAKYDCKRALIVRPPSIQLQLSNTQQQQYAVNNWTHKLCDTTKQPRRIHIIETQFKARDSEEKQQQQRTRPKSYKQY